MKNQSCPKPDCMYLHELGDSEASFTKEEMHQGKHQEYEKRLHDALIAQTAATNNISPTGNTKLGEAIKLSNDNGCADGEPGKDAWPCLSTSPVNTKDTNTVTAGTTGGGTPTAATTTTTTKSAKTNTKENGKKKKEAKAKKTSTSSTSSSASSTTTTAAAAVAGQGSTTTPAAAVTTLTATVNGKDAITVVNGGSGSAINNNNSVKDQGFNTNNKDLNNKDLDTTKPTMSADEELNLIQEIEKEADALSAAELDAKADTPSLRLVDKMKIKL